MYALLLLAGLVLLLSLAGIAGWLAYRYTRKRWLQIAAPLFVLWLPFWDVIPGLYFYYKAIREVGGVHIYRTVKAEGYLDLTATDCYSCWSWLRNSPYEYIELRRTVRGMQFPEMEPGPGYYEYRLLPSGSSACERFESLPNAERIMRRRGIQGKCLAVTHRDYPVSQYEESVRTTQLPFGPRIVSRRVRDRATDATLAEGNLIYFQTWLGKQLEMTFWSFNKQADGSPIWFQMKDVVVPP